MRAITFSALLLALVLASGCVNQSLPPIITYPTCAQFEGIAAAVSKTGGDCVSLSARLNSELQKAGYNSKIVHGLLWDFNCTPDPALPLKCFNGAHDWVQLTVLIESTNGLPVPPNLEKFYQADVQ